jgi:hypothetical protein
MHQGLKYFLLFISISLSGACASSCGGSEQANNGSGSNTNVVVPVRADNLPPGANGNSNMVNGLQKTNMKNPTLDNSNVKVIDANQKTAPPTKRLPDNSFMETSMSKEGHFVETRKFVDHPDLVKLVRIIKDKNDIKFEVHLKNGKVYDLAGGKLDNYRTVDAYSILTAVGVKPTVIDRSGGKSKQEQLREREVIPPAIPKRNR